MMHTLESTSICDIKYKIVFLGNMSVGKSSIIDRFINNSFDESRQDTVGIDFLGKNIAINNRVHRLLLWDTAGQEKFRSLIPAYLRDADCAVVVYDIGNERSFEELDSWIKLYEGCSREGAGVVIVGNKSDLEDKKVSASKGLKYAKEKQFGFQEVSAKRGIGIQELFEFIVVDIEEKLKTKGKEVELEELGTEKRLEGSEDKMKKETVVKVENNEKRKQRTCCYL